MLQVHIPSVGPEAEGTRQSPDRGHMVSGSTGWEGVQGPARFPCAERKGTPLLGLGRPNAAGEAVEDSFLRVSGPLGFASPADSGPGP